jgi:S-adenosylmethionine:tRNA ribosyltransferase-isomerase
MSAVLADVLVPNFALPDSLEAHEPPEARGLARDEVRLMVARRGDERLAHARFHELPHFLDPGDLLVINVSAAIPAALPALRGDGTALELRLSTPLPDGLWLVELRLGPAPFAGATSGERLQLPGGARAELLEQYAGSRRLWLAELVMLEPLARYLELHGRPIRYRHVRGPVPLDAYRNVYAREPGSAEAPTAGRPFTTGLISRLVAKGVLVAPLVLHAGVSSLELGEAPYPERYRVTKHTARLVNAVHGWGGRVVAVGTTVVRALETVADADGTIAADEGWTALVIGDEHELKAVDGLVTGWHEPSSSHMDLLRAVGGEELLERSYLAALEHGYLWHEFGDSHLILA